MKYKVGDQVRIKTWKQMEREYGLKEHGGINIPAGFTKRMEKYCETIQEIKKAGPRVYTLDGVPFIWTDEMIVGLANKKSIHITTDGTTTHAVLKDGKSVIKRSKAVCAPSDTFDFETGARVAFDRLISPEVLEVKRPANVGEWVKALCSGTGFSQGETLRVIAVEDKYNKGSVYVRTKNETIYSGDCTSTPIKHPFSYMPLNDYVVLENYQPPEEPKELAKPELPKFTYEGFKRGDLAVNCTTQEDADIFCAYLHGKGDIWCDGDSYLAYTKWNECEGETCYYGDGEFSSKSYAEANAHTVIPFKKEELD